MHQATSIFTDLGTADAKMYYSIFDLPHSSILVTSLYLSSYYGTLSYHFSSVSSEVGGLGKSSQTHKQGQYIMTRFSRPYTNTGKPVYNSSFVLGSGAKVGNTIKLTLYWSESVCSGTDTPVVVVV